jgi:hypothetical protein
VIERCGVNSCCAYRGEGCLSSIGVGSSFSLFSPSPFGAAMISPLSVPLLTAGVVTPRENGFSGFRRRGGKRGDSEKGLKEDEL